MKQTFSFLFSHHSRNLKKHSFIKRLLAASCLILCMIGSAKAQTPPDNEAFYLVGTMNNWTTVTENAAADYEYKLTDPDGDGIYTGSFYIPEGELEFKVFSEPGDWSEVPYYGYGNFIYGWDDSFCVFNEDNPYNTIILSPGDTSNNVKIINWKGGVMNISINWIPEFEDNYLPQICSITGSNQPKEPPISNIYIIGDFNNWQLPDAASDNGSVKLNYFTFSLTAQSYHIEKNFNKGDISIAICKYDESTGEYGYYKPTTNDLPFTLYQFASGTNTYSYAYSQRGEWISTSDPKSLSMNIMDWQGGEIEMQIYDQYDGNVTPYFINHSNIKTEFPSEMYVLTEQNGIKEINPVETSYYAWANCPGKDVSILFTSENSLNPKPENCWGLEKSLEEYGFDNTHSSGDLFLVRGGKPFSYSFNGTGNLYVYVNFYISQANINLTFKDDSDNLYVVGDVENDGVANKWLEPSQSNADIYNKYFKLSETAPRVFEGVYYIPEVENALPNFRFYHELTGWDGGASMGSGWYDFTNMEVNLDEGPADLDITIGGKGNWSPTLGSSWQSNYVKMTVDLNWNKLTLEVVNDNQSEIPALENDLNTSESWYNLQGIKVERPRAGIYIRVKDGKSNVVILK